MKQQKDNLFDGKFTYLDAVKIALLIVTAFSTWNVVDIMTPVSSWAWVRKIAAVAVVEGAFLGFEFATSDAKSRRQVRWATIGFFCSLLVISLFAGLSGLLEFGGAELLNQHASDWLNLSWSVGDVIKSFALLTLVLWIAALASIYRFYSLNDPDKRAELESIEIDETITTEANNARRIAFGQAKPVIASHRAIAKVRENFSHEMSADQMERLVADVAATLKQNYSVMPETGFTAPAAPVQSPLQKLREIIDRPFSSPVVVDPKQGFVPGREYQADLTSLQGMSGEPFFPTDGGDDKDD